MKRRTYGPLVAPGAGGRLWGTPGSLTFLREAAMLTHLFLNRLLWPVAGLPALVAAGTGLRPHSKEMP